MTDVVIVGGGPAGLVGAGHLAEMGHDVTIFEQETQIGGRVRSRRERGFVFDRGFQVLFTAYPALREELDLAGLSLRPFSPGVTLASRDHRSRLVDPSAQLSAVFETLANRDITFGDKFRLYQLKRDLLRKSTEEILSADDKRIDVYLANLGFSERFRERFVGPLYGGITLDRSLSSSRLIFEYTFKMLTQGTAALPADGMGEVTRQLGQRAREQGVTIETDTRVDAVEPDSEGAIVETNRETVEATAAIVATDSRTAYELTGCETIPTDGPGVVTQYISLPADTPLPTGKRLHLNIDTDGPNHIAPLSAVAPAYAPSDRQLLSATFLGAQPGDDADLMSSVQATLEGWYPELSVGDLELERTDRIEFAQFAQPPGFRSTLPSVDEPTGQVYLGGEYTEWSSIQGAMRSGQRVATVVDQTLSVLN